jgi:hypothetical protein
LYAAVQGQTVPDRNYPLAINDEGKKKNKKKNKKIKKEAVQEIVDEIPDALDKVLKEFYTQPAELLSQEKKIPKDSIELKHAKDLSQSLKKPKKPKKSKKISSNSSKFDELHNEFTAITGKTIYDTEEPLQTPSNQIQLPTKRSVAFNLKLNKTLIYDKKKIISANVSPSLSTPSKSILKAKKSKPVELNPSKKKKKVKNSSSST